MKYFTADFHFDHGPVIEWCNRPWKRVAQMNKGLIRNYNNVVDSDDEVYILGDFSIKPKSYKSHLRNVVDQLKGRKHLILGNHDYLDPFDYIDIGFWSVHTSLDVEEFTLVHDPSVSQIDRSQKFLVGHVHDFFKKHKNCVNVGVDVWDYKPVSIEEVRIAFEQK